MSTVTLRSQNHLNFIAPTGGTTYTVPAPATIVNGDFMVMAVAIGANTSAPTPVVSGNGYTVVTPTSGGAFPLALNSGFFESFYVFTKFASSEPSTYTFTQTGGGASPGAQFWIGGYQNVNATTPIEFCTTATGTGTTSTATSGTAANAGDGVVFLECDFNDTTNLLTIPTGTTPTFTGEYVGWVSGVNDNLVIADGAMTAGGATGSKAITNNNTGPDPWAAVLLGLNVAAGGGPAAPIVPMLRAMPTGV